MPMRGQLKETEVETFFLSEYAGLCRLAFIMLGDRRLAEEVAMDGIVHALTGWNRIRSLEYPEAYVRKTVMNICCSRLRRMILELRANARTAARSDGNWNSPELRSDVLVALRSLPERQLGCVILRYFEDRSERQIAGIMGCSVGTVKSQLFKARSKLQLLLGGVDD